MSEDIKNLSEIIELCQDELNKNDENVTAILDLQDLKSLKNIINDYQRQLEINQEHQKVNGELQQKIKELEDADLTTIYLNGVYDGKSKALKNNIPKTIIEKAIGNLEYYLKYHLEHPDNKRKYKYKEVLEQKIKLLKELLERG